LKEQYETVTGEPYPAGGRAPKKKKGAAAAPAAAASGELNCGASQPWWDGDKVPESLVVKKLAEMGLSSDSAQATTADEEMASWCTSLLVKCKKKKTIFMITSAPGHKCVPSPVAADILCLGYMCAGAELSLGLRLRGLKLWARVLSRSGRT